MTYAFALIACTAAALLIHELGHLAAARVCRVTATEVCLGLGRRLFGFRVGSLHFNLRALPLGSFVRLDARELRSRPARQQLLVHASGVGVNLIAATLADGTLFGWINLLLAAGNLLPLYQHDGWKCGLVLMRAILGRPSRPVEWTYTFSGCFISLVIINTLVRVFLHGSL